MNYSLTWNLTTQVIVTWESKEGQNKSPGPVENNNLNKWKLRQLLAFLCLSFR